MPRRADARMPRWLVVGLGGALAGTVVAGLSGCSGDDDDDLSARPIVWSLGEDAFWPDPRQPVGVGEGRILVTNNLDDTVSVLDYAHVGDDALSELARVPVGFSPVEKEGPHQLVADPAAEYYYVGISNYVPGAGSGPHGAFGTGTAIGHVLKMRASDDLPVDSVDVDRNPGNLSMTADGSRVLVTHYDLLRIQEVVATGGDVRDMDSRLAILDPVSMQQVAMVPVCPAAHGVAIAPDGSWAMASCLPDQVAIVDLVAEDHPVRRVNVIPNPGPVSAPICAPFALTMAPAGDTVWISCFADGRVLAYDVGADTMDAARAVGPLPGPAVFGTTTRDGQTLFVPHQGAGGITVIDTATGDIEDDVFLDVSQCFAPHIVRLNDDESLLMAVCEGNKTDPGTFIVLDRATLSVQRSVPLGLYPIDLEILRYPD